MNYLNIDQTIDYVKNIVDNIQCPLCDKSDGQRMRYSCGHTACDDCVGNAKDCQICLTPTPVSCTQPVPDDALTQRVKHVSILLKAYQDLFNTDVFQRKRLSEQLKIEKELFPKCIQAPAKYENKRKSTFNKNKENRHSTIFPGEETSKLKENINMESSVSYVQQWLNKNDRDFSRKPFRDLNLNTQFDKNVILPENNNKILSNKEIKVPVLKKNSKTSHFKTIVKNFSPFEKRKQNIKSRIKNSDIKKVKNKLYQSYKDDVSNETKKDYDNDESGIFMDQDPIIIDDSQDTVNDKDKNAWLAVLEANKNEEIQSTSFISIDCSDAKSFKFTNKQTRTKSDQPQIIVKQDTKVPFIKKSYITETCTLCNSVENEAAGQSKVVKITIDSVNFTTTINILNNVKDSSKLSTTNQSVEVQTEVCETVVKNQFYPINESDNNTFKKWTEKKGMDKNSQKSDTISEDLFADEGKNNANDYNRINSFKVIEESDSDMDMDGSGPLPVKVDVHRSCDESEYGVLSEIENHQEHNTRKRRGPRGLTPTSTDSSEKENFNPNRVKKHIPKKKKCHKK